MKTNLLIIFNFFFLISFFQNFGQDTIIATKLSYKFPKNEEKIRNVLSSTFFENEITPKEFEFIHFIGSYKISGLGQTIIYKIKLGHTVPAVYSRGYYLVIGVENKLVYLIAFDKLELIKLHPKDKYWFFSGRFIRRSGYSNFDIYHFRDTKMVKIFSSDEYVSNFSYDCISYRNGNLSFKNIDINNDGYLDLYFDGIKNYYCHGLENNGRLDVKPIKSEFIKIKYLYNKELNNWVKAH